MRPRRDSGSRNNWKIATQTPSRICGGVLFYDLFFTIPSGSSQKSRDGCRTGRFFARAGGVTGAHDRDAGATLSRVVALRDAPGRLDGEALRRGPVMGDPGYRGPAGFAPEHWAPHGAPAADGGAGV